MNYHCIVKSKNKNVFFFDELVIRDREVDNIGYKHIFLKLKRTRKSVYRWDITNRWDITKEEDK